MREACYREYVGPDVSLRDVCLDRLCATVISFQRKYDLSGD